MKKLILIPIMMILLVGMVYGFSTDPADYIFVDDGVLTNNSISITGTNLSKLTTTGYGEIEAPSWEYTTGEEGFGNLSIDADDGNQNSYGLGNLTNVTMQVTYFDDMVDVDATNRIDFRTEGDAGIVAFVGVVTTTSQVEYTYDTATILATTTNISRTNDPINFTIFIAPLGEYFVVFINGTKIVNETISQGFGAFRLVQDALKPLDARMDDLYIWSGTPDDRPQGIAPAVDNSSPTFGADSINNTLPKITEDVLLSQVVSDETDLDFVTISHNQSGVLTNQTPQDISGLSFNASETITVTLPKGSVIGYQWHVNDTSGNSNTSVIRTFAVGNTPPTIPTVIFPTANLLTNLQPLDINVTFDQDADGDTLTIHYFINGTINQTSLTNTTLNASDNTYIIEVSVTDGEDFSANASVTFELDTVNPLITVIEPINGSSISTDITVDISCNDINVFILNYTFHNGTDVIRSGQDNVSVDNVLEIQDSIPIENLTDGQFFLNISCSDSHTQRFIPDYSVIDIANGKLFITDQNVDIQIVHVGQPIGGSINHVRLDDRYTFEFGTTPTREQHIFKVITSKHEIEIIEDSGIKGHLVIRTETGGHWIDFENGDPTSTVEISRLNKKQVNVIVNSNDFNFRSIGGLNVAEQQIEITLDTSSVITPETGTRALITRVGILGLTIAIIIGALISVFFFIRGRKE